MQTELIVLNQKIELLEDLKCEIKEHCYSSIDDVIAHINIDLDILNDSKESYEYELQANLDHMTSEKENVHNG